MYMPRERMIQTITQLLDEMNHLNNNETLNIMWIESMGFTPIEIQKEIEREIAF